jgi:hypothetical protein
VKVRGFLVGPSRYDAKSIFMLVTSSVAANPVAGGIFSRIRLRLQPRFFRDSTSSGAVLFTVQFPKQGLPGSHRGIQAKVIKFAERQTPAMKT